MSNLTNKIDFVVLVSVKNANSNGDPLNGNRPRSDFNGFGEMSDVCIKRKIRNRMQDMGERIFVQSDDRCNDGYNTLKERAEKEIGKVKKEKKGKKKETEDGLTEKQFAEKACEIFSDVRTFGQVFAISSDNKEGDKEGDNDKKSDGTSVGVRGPVSIHQAVSVDPVEIESMQITKSVSGDKKEGQERGSDTMGMKHFVRFGLYKIKGSVNVQLAEKTGFSDKDAETVKECLRTLFINDASAARPDGSMEVVKLYWWKHSCKDGQYSAAKVHNLVKVKRKNGVTVPSSTDDYEITLDTLPDLKCEIIDGI